MKATQARSILMKVFEEKKARNASYSLRAFSRDLGISPASLSQVLSAKRNLSIANAKKVAFRLGLTHKDLEAFVLDSKRDIWAESESDRKVLTDDQFKLLADWQHLAILNLTSIENCKADPKWIAKRLNLDITTVKNAIARLEKMELLKREDGVLRRIGKILRAEEFQASDAIRLHHKQKLELAAKALEHNAFDRREIISMTLPTNLKHMDDIKRRIRRFAASLSTYCRNDSATDVCAFGIQFFALTDSN